METQCWKIPPKSLIFREMIPQENRNFEALKKSPLNPWKKDPKVWNVPVRTYTKMAAIHHGFLFGWLFSMLFLWLRRLRRRPLWRRDFSVSIKVLALALQWETGGRGDIGSSCHLPAGRHFSYDHAEPLSPFIFTISLELKASEAKRASLTSNLSFKNPNNSNWFHDHQHNNISIEP